LDRLLERRADEEPGDPVGPGYQVPFAERVRKERGIITIAIGLITEAEAGAEKSSPKARPTWLRSRAAFSGIPVGPGMPRKNWARRRASRRNTCARVRRRADVSASAGRVGPDA